MSLARPNMRFIIVYISHNTRVVNECSFQSRSARSSIRFLVDNCFVIDALKNRPKKRPNCCSSVKMYNTKTV